MDQPTGLILNPDNPQLQNQPSDVLPPQDRQDVTNLDENDLSGYVLEQFRNDIKDKEEFGWVAKRKYDLESYYMIKDEALRHFPYEGASNSRVPLTPTLLDTAHANVKASIWSDSGDPIRVKGVGVEDMRKAPILTQYMNFKVNNEMDMETPMDSTIFRTFLHGTGFTKVIRDFDNNILMSSLDIENIYLPIDAAGCQIKDTDHVIQIIPLTYNDLQARKPFYKNIDKIAPGIGITRSLAAEQLTMLRDIATGQQMYEKQRRDLYYIMEAYATYYPKNASSGPSGPMRGLKPLELIVWMSPHGGQIHRIRKNEEMLRPFAEFSAYPNPGRIFAMSLPEKIRGVQEDIDYANKQNTDALDRAIAPAMYVDDTTSFDRQRSQRVPGGIYPIGKGNKPQYDAMPPVEMGFERKMQGLWFQAEQLLGITDVTVGGQTKSGRTLGETEIRVQRGDVRFNSVFSRFEKGWKKAVQLIYENCNRYEDRTKKLKIIGYSDLKSLDEIFPTSNPDASGLAIEGQFDFSFGGSPISEREQQKNDAINFAVTMLANPLVAASPANIWRVTKVYADAMGQRDLEAIITRPKEVDIFSVQEFIQRVMSGQYDIQIRPGIDTDSYVFEIQLFMQSESFKVLDPRGQQTLMIALRRAYVMSVAERQAVVDATQVAHGQKAQAMAAKGPQPGQMGRDGQPQGQDQSQPQPAQPAQAA